MEASGPGSTTHHRSGRSSNEYPEHRRDYRDPERSRRYESSSSSRRERYRDNYRHEGSSSSRSHDADRDYRRRHERDHHHTSSGSSRRQRSRTPSSPRISSRSGRRRDDDSSSSRHRHDRDYSHGEGSVSPTAVRGTTENIRILRASRSITPTMPQSSSDAHHQYASERQHDSKTTDRSHYFDGIKSERQILPSVDDGDFDKEQIHKEMQERLIRHLAREGKVYPPPKPQASHPVFANDGSFLETFKRLQEQQLEPASTDVTAGQEVRRAPPQTSQQAMFGKRRGGKILKTGVVAKPKIIEEDEAANKNDAWAMYLQEVKKYKSVSCDTDAKTRPLVK